MRKVLVEDGHRISHVVATGGQGPAEGGFVDVERGLADEIPYKAGWLPSVGGETEADAFAFGQCEFVMSCPDEVGDIKQLLAKFVCELPGHPSGVACAREIEYHGAKVQNNYQLSIVNYQLFCTFAPDYEIFHHFQL